MKFKNWLLRVLIMSLHKADANGDGWLELSIKLNIETKEIQTQVK